MTKASQLLQSLEQIAVSYTFFENDQVLTADQLNSVTEYLNDQARLTRVNLLGVGVISGLRVSLQGNTVKITRGLGISTDGDLLYYDKDTIFDCFRVYDDGSEAYYPKYPPFYKNDITSATRAIISPVYELIAQGVQDTRRPIYQLSEFKAPLTSKSLNDMAAILLMESYRDDPDICSGTDCDNLGQDCQNTIRLLLIDKSQSLAKPIFPIPHESFNKLKAIVADRPVIPSSLSSAADLAQNYRSACSKISEKLLTNLSKIYPECGQFLTDLFPSDPYFDSATEKGWKSRLTEIQRAATGANLGIQYYYDFLKDLAETYNQFRDLLFGETTWCCPDFKSFPKHLLLGNLVPGIDSEENRTLFYSSPLLSRTSESLNHAKFLIRKLDLLIKTFKIPASSTTTPIRITPSFFEDQPLEERAIPYYYQVNSTEPLYTCWNYRLHQRGMDSYIYSYHAIEYTDQESAAEPLRSQIGRFSFFRVEGHLGQNARLVLPKIQDQIKSENLPFGVLSVKLEPGSFVFTTLVAKYPGVEHFGGAVRGGTLIVLSGVDDSVIGDLMLPYFCGIIPRIPGSLSLSGPLLSILTQARSENRSLILSDLAKAGTSFTKVATSIGAAKALNPKALTLIDGGVNAIFTKFSPPANARDRIKQDVTYLLRLVTYCCILDDTSPIQYYESGGFNETIQASSIWYIEALSFIKKNHGLSGDLQRIVEQVLSYTIHSLSLLT